MPGLYTQGRAVGGRERGGGVGFYIKRGVSARLLAHPEAPGVDQMWLRLTANGLKLAIGTAYRPPWQSIEIFLDALTDSIASFSGFDHVILTGDLNIDLLVSNSDTRKLTEFLNCFGLEQYVGVPTHFTDHSATLIDLLCANIKINDVVVDHIPDLSRHSFITFKLRVKKEKKSSKYIVFRPIKNINLESFSRDLNNINWNSIISRDINRMVSDFNSLMKNIFDDHAPIKKILVKDQSYPWITYNIREMMKTRDKAHARYHKSNIECHKTYYKDLKNTVISAIHAEKTSYFQYNIHSNYKNPKKLWKNIKQHVANFNQKCLDIPAHFQDPSLINNHFLSLPESSDIQISDLTYYEFNRHGPLVFSMQTVDEAVVGKIIRHFSTNAMGIDDLSMDMILLTLPQTLGVITAMVNISIETGVFPTFWKTAIVRPIPKVNNPTSLSDLRPISILPFLSKIIEKVICIQVTAYLEECKIIPSKQSGFRKGHSTTTALLDVVDNVLDAQDRGEGTILTLLDFSRAFDTINISLLLSKLSYYGFDSAATRWFASYLSDRSQLVELRHADGTSFVSANMPVTRGVPQGSILGPILFVLYSTDLISTIANSKYHQYADDLQLYTSFKPENSEVAVDRLNEDLERISRWCKSNNLILNPIKTKFLVLGSKKVISNILSRDLKVQVGGVLIDRVNEARNLGLLMDGSLHFENYLLNTARNCFYRLSVLYKMREYLSTDLRIHLCDSLVLSKLSYVDNVFGECLLARSKKLIQRIQNACVRFCFPIPQRAHISPYINSHKLLNMSSRRTLHFAALLFGIIKYQKPHYLYEKLQFSDRHIRFAIRLTCPHHRTAAFRGSFRYAATKCWNNLPPPIRNSKTVYSFKKSLKNHLISSQVQIKR